MALEVDDQGLREIVVSFQHSPGQALEQLKPLAAEGNTRAIVLLAMGLLQQDSVDEGLAYARQAVERGVGAVAQTYALDLTSRGRDDLRAQAPEFVVAAIESGWTVDLRNLFAQALGQGNVELVFQALSLALGSSPPPAARRQWDELVTKATADREQITAAATAVATQREYAVAAITEEEEAVKARRQNAEGAADELGLVLSDVAAHSLANAYSNEARRTERQARWYTILAIMLGCLSVAASLYGLLTLKEGSGVDTALARAAFGLPFALFVPFISSLANAHRHEAWRLRHVELQIRTANPFLTLLGDDQRRETLAALALRFFPGQENLGKDSQDGQGLPLDIIDAIRVLLREQKPAVVSAPVVTPTPIEG